MKTHSSSAVITFLSKPYANGDLLTSVSAEPSGPLPNLELLTPPYVVAFIPWLYIEFLTWASGRSVGKIDFLSCKSSKFFHLPRYFIISKLMCRLLHCLVISILKLNIMQQFFWNPLELRCPCYGSPIYGGVFVNQNVANLNILTEYFNQYFKTCKMSTEKIILGRNSP
jgi:hypothetical protein